MRSITSILSTLTFIALLAAGCTGQNGGQNSADSASQQESQVDRAVAVLHPTEGNEAAGTVTFTREPDGIHVRATLTGLSEGEHGFHIHQYGDCSAPDGTSAGGHYNPAGVEHGARSDSVRHVGDLGNAAANAEGTAVVDYVDPNLSLDGPNGIVGRGVVVHGGADDFESQPSGAAGPRVACGAIGIGNPGM